MAANYIVINSKFKPFSYEEMLHPVQMATEAHQEIETQYNELATKANVWDNLANEQTDPYAYNMYKTYANDLEKQAEILAREGLTPASRQSMLDMRKRYSSEITPIEQAYTTRMEQAKQQQEALLKDPTLILSRRASMTSLDDYIRNPQLGYESVSGNMLTQQAAVAAKELAKYQREKPREWRRILNGQYFETLMNSGYTPEQVVLAAAQDPNAPKELREIVDRVYNSSGIDAWGSEADKQAALNYIGRGLYSAIGETQYQTLADRSYDYFLREAMNRKSGSGEDLSDDRLPYVRVPRGQVVEGVNTSKLEEDQNIIRAIINNRSLLSKPASRPKIVGSSQTGYVQHTSETIYPYDERYKALSERYETTDLQELDRRIQNDIDHSAERNSIYRTNYTNNDLMNQYVLSNLRAGAKNDKIQAYEYKNDKRKGMLEVSELEDIKQNSGFITFDPMTSTLLYNYETSDGKQKQMELDPEVLDTPDRILKSRLDEMKKFRDNKDYINLSIAADAYMSMLDNMFHTQAKVQSNTDSNLSLPYTEPEYLE